MICWNVSVPVQSEVLKIGQHRREELEHDAEIDGGAWGAVNIDVPDRGCEDGDNGAKRSRHINV